MITQCSVTLLESALAGTLPTEDENSLHHHLEECEMCSAALENMAGGTALCHEAASLLAADDFDAALPSRDEWSEIDFTVEHLEPSDEPNVLGRLGGYDVLEVIGRGGMSVVLKGFDRELKRFVAIKVLAPHLLQSSLAKKRFAREAQAAAAVVHPHVLAIHQVQPHGRLPFLVMPLVAGESLAQRLASRGVLELKAILRIGMQASAGLAAAHEQGLVHRDVKPANILLEKGIERTVLTDFGLARAADDISLSRYGIIAGTPQYMSPEQAKGEAVDGRSDLFGLGCVLYEMASGISPFRADSTMATLRRLIDEPPQALASLNPELPPWFIAIVDRLLEKDPSQRFRSAKEVSELLEGCLAHVQQPANVPLPAGVPVVKPIAPPGRLVPRWSKWRRFGTIAAILVFLLGGFGAFQAYTDEPSDISGEWTGEGEGWGKVVLRRTGPNKYAGTYTDTIGKEPGKIELKWSRIERRYNGTWSEGEERFGKLSVRSVGGEIRGAYTTSRDSHINPGTPELADLSWVRASAASHEKDTPAGIGKKPPEASWEFGPDVSRGMKCPQSDYKPPEGSEPRPFYGRALRFADGKEFNLPTKSASGKGDISPEELGQWCDETKVNLVIDYRTKTDQWELKLRNVRFAEMESNSDPTSLENDWKKPSANELHSRFAKLEWKKTTTAETDPKGKGFQSLLLTQGTHEVGLKFAFETADGHRGILQILNGTLIGRGRAPIHVSIRYKFLQPADAPAKREGDGGVSIGKKAPESSWAFGPVLNQMLICPESDRDPPRKSPSGDALWNGTALRLEDDRKFNLPMKPVPGKGDMSPEELAKWYDETKVNLVIDYRTVTDQWEFKLRNVKFADLPSVPSGSANDWKTPSAHELLSRFSKLEWRKTTNAETDPKGKGFQSLLLTRGTQPGMTFAFETSDGHQGILQFVVSNNRGGISRSASIRYKLLQPADAPAKREGGGVASIKLNFGPVLSRTLICPPSYQDTKGDTPAKTDPKGDSPAKKDPSGMPPSGSALRNGSALRLEDGKLFNLPAKSASGKGDISPEELAKWYDETKVNLVIDYRTETDQWEFKLRNVRLAELPTLRSDSGNDWKTFSANELQQRFSKLEWRKTTPAGTDPKEKGFQSLLLTRGEQPGMTFAFETSDGHQGILQFMSSTHRGDSYRNASIRYKLLQPAATPAKPEGDAGSKTPTAKEPVKPKDGPLGMKFVPLPKGTFYMG